MRKRHKRVSGSLRVPSTALALGGGVASRKGNSDQPGALWPLALLVSERRKNSNFTVLAESESPPGLTRRTRRGRPAMLPLVSLSGAYPPAGFGTVGPFKGGTGMLR